MSKKTTKKALLMSVLSLLVCVAMLVGTTFAWFTDSVTSANNVIQSGNLDIELEYWDGTAWKSVTDATDILTNELFEPGVVEVAYLRLKNVGSLALQYRLGVKIVDEDSGVNQAGNEFNLSDYIYFGAVEGVNGETAAYTNRKAAVDALTESNPIQSGYSKEESLLPGGEQYLAVVVYMPESVDNVANHNGITVPAIDLNVNVFATQFTYEEDSFDETYDDLTLTAGYDELMEYKGADGTYLLLDDVSAENVVFMGNGVTTTIDLNGKTITAENTNQFIFGAQQGGKLTLDGDGVVNAGKGMMTNKGGAEIVVNSGTYNTTVTNTLNGMKLANLAQNDSKIVINGGTFTTNVEDACIFFATSNSRIEINGGFFENTADDTPKLLSVGTNKYHTNRIVITGGTFVNYNPLADYMCYTGEWPAAGEAAFGGPWILIPGGYTVVSETQANGDVWYSVVPV